MIVLSLSFSRRLVRAVLLPALLIALLLALDPPVARAQGVDPQVAQTLRQVEQDLAAVDRALDSRTDADIRRDLRTRTQAAQQSATTMAATLHDQLALVDARIAGLGSPSAGETPEIRAERARLAAEHAAIDAAGKRAGLAGVESQQLLDELDRSATEQFNETITARVDSPLSPAFWGEVVAAMPRDLRRIDLFVRQGVEQVRAPGARRAAGRVPWPAALGAILALVLLFPLRVAGRAIGQRYLIEGAPGHRLRRSGYALWRVTLGTLSPLLAAFAFGQGLRWSGLVPDRWSALPDALLAAAGIAGFVAALTGAMLMRQQPTWRVAPIDDETATRLRPLSWMLAALSFVVVIVNAFNAAIGASPAATVAAQAAQALLHLLLVGALLLTLGRIRAERALRDDVASMTTSAGLGLATLVAWLVVVAAVIALLTGYIGLSHFLSQFVVWAIILGSTVYLLGKAVDDVATTLFVRDSRLGATLVRGLGLRGSTIDQFGLILSGTLRLLLLVTGLALLFFPFGAGGGLGSMFGRLGGLAQGVQVAGIAISPAAILRGAVVLAIGLALVRAFMRWLEGRYLPVTDLDGSGRNSVSLVARYVGIALATIWSLASLGIGMERIALLLSALSVGIGFGLQAITQNFVSGLILLAERPIKIGDLVRVGTDEGDVKRISVRSTEIELGDHSTLIVPNSELITKTVLNKTLASPLGRVQVQFSIPLEADAALVRRIVSESFAAEPAILDEPAPSVFIDSIADGRILFNCFAHVASPRSAYGARSAVLSTLLARLREEAVDIGTVPQRLELAPGAQWREEDRAAAAAGTRAT